MCFCVFCCFLPSQAALASEPEDWPALLHAALAWTGFSWDERHARLTFVLILNLYTSQMFIQNALKRKGYINVCNIYFGKNDDIYMIYIYICILIYSIYICCVTTLGGNVFWYLKSDFTLKKSVAFEFGEVSTFAILETAKNTTYKVGPYQL